MGIYLLVIITLLTGCIMHRTSSLYHVIESPELWIEANASCQDGLATPSSLTELELVMKDREEGDYWLGGYLHDEGWQWISDNSSLYTEKGCYEADYTPTRKSSKKKCGRACYTYNGEGYIAYEDDDCICLSDFRWNRLVQLYRWSARASHVYYVSFSRNWRNSWVLAERYIGYFVVQSTQTIPRNSVQACSRACTKYQYFTLQRDGCTCLSFPPTITAENQRCNAQCNGNPGEICGSVDDNYASVYTRTDSRYVVWGRNYPKDDERCAYRQDPLKDHARLWYSSDCESKKQVLCYNDEDNEHHITHDTHTWEDAVEQCAYPSQIDEDSSTHSVGDYYGEFWIGLHRVINWIWFNNNGTGVAMSIQKPGAYDENCLALHRSYDGTLKLVPRGCDETLSFICQDAEARQTSSTATSVPSTSSNTDMESTDATTSQTTSPATPGSLTSTNTELETSVDTATTSPTSDAGTQQSQTEQHSQSENNNTGVYAGIGVGIVVVVIAVTVAVFFIWRRRCQKKKKKPVDFRMNSIGSRNNQCDSQIGNNQTPVAVNKAYDITVPGRFVTSSNEERYPDEYGKIWTSSSGHDAADNDYSYAGHDVSRDYDYTLATPNRTNHTPDRTESVEYDKLGVLKGSDRRESTGNTYSHTGIGSEDYVTSGKSNHLATTYNTYSHPGTDDDIYENNKDITNIDLSTDYAHANKL